MSLLFKKNKKSWRKKRNFSKSRSAFFLRKRSSVKILKRLAIAGAVFLIVYFIFFSQFFLIKEIEIEGNRNVSLSNIEEVANNEISQPILWLVPGNNFFLSKNENIEIALLNKFSEIKSVEIKKKFPNSVEIKIIEKNPLVIWCRLGDCYYIDNNGAAFLSADKDLLMEKDDKFIKIMEQLEIEEELEDNPEESKPEILEEEKKSDVAYKLNDEQFEKVRVFFTREKQDDWAKAYPALFATAGEDLGLPVLSEPSGQSTHYSLSFAKKIIDDLKRIEIDDGEKIFQVRIDFNYENKSIFINVIREKREKEKEEEVLVFEPIKINDKVSDSDFINFAVEINREIKNKTALNINYYKTKGTKSRELIAYTDKNTRIYFNAIDSADLQVNYLKDFLFKGTDRKKIDSLEYIYLKSGNKIFYK